MLVLIAGIAIGQTQTATTVVSHVSVIDVERGGIRRDMNVTIRDGFIFDVSSKPPTSNGATMVDGTGKFMIPGLWDCHVHCWSDKMFFPLFIANGVTGIRDMFGPVAYVNSWRKQIESGATIGPRIVAAGRIVDGPKPIWPGSVTVANAEEGRKAVEAVIKEGSDFVKVYSLLPRDGYFAIAEEAKRRGKVFCGHVPNLVTAKEASEAGQKSFEHMYSVLAGCSDKESELMASADLSRMQRARTLIDSYNSTKAKSLFQTFKKNGTWQCPTLTIQNALGKLDDPEFTKDPRIAYVSPFITATWDVTKDKRFKAYTAEDYAAIRLRFSRELALVGDMAKAGVGILAGTDTPNPYALPGFGIHDELALMVKGGLTPLQALQTATLNPAKYFGWEKTMGSVKPKKVADLVLLDANPLEDIRNTTKIAGVFVAGRYLDRAQLAGMVKKSAQASDNGSRYIGFGCDDH